MTRERLAIALAAFMFAAGFGVTASPAQAQWHRGYGYHHPGIGPGAIIGGALLGLGVGALLRAPYPPPPVAYAPPPPPYYPPPFAYPPPPYPYAPPVYYAPY